MGCYNYSPPSSSEASLDYGSEGEFGRFPEVGDEEVNSAVPEKNPGRVFYGCKNTMDGGHHLFKWLDEVLMDEIKDIRASTTTQGEFIRRIHDWYHFQEFLDIDHLEKELPEVKALLIKNRSAMTLLKKIKE